MLPSVSASASENFSFGRGLTADNTYDNANTTSTSFNLGGDIPIFTGLDITNEIKAGKLQLQAAIEDLSKAKEDISVAVAQARNNYNLALLTLSQLLELPCQGGIPPHSFSERRHRNELLYQFEPSEHSFR